MLETMMSGHCGLTTEEALDRLRKNIHEELESFTKSHEKSGLAFVADMCSAHCIPLTRLGLILLLLEIIVLLIAVVESAADQSMRWPSICAELFLLLFFSSISIIACFREHHLKQHEMQRLIQAFAEVITYDNKHPWTDVHYPDLSLPETNSISLVWTYRDYVIVNLPHNLLVEGDVIILGPSRVAPAECKLLCHESQSYASCIRLETGDIFNPSVENEGESPYQPYPRQKFEVLQAPVRSIVSTYLQSSQTKNDSMLNTNMSIILYLFEARIIWIILVLSFVVNILRLEFFRNDVGDYSEMIFLMQAYTILPLLPLVYPVLWVGVSLYGTARLRTLFEMYTQRHYDLTESEDISLEHVNCPRVLWTFWEIIRGHPQGLPRTVNLLHTLGSITTSCCVDKEGILCYTNPVPEKMFFFKDQKKMKHTHEIENLLEETNEFYVKDDVTVTEITGAVRGSSGGSSCFGSSGGSGGCSSGGSSGVNDIEVLNISPDPKSPFGIQFDDIDWEEQLSSLKPLGLNMLFNSPCQYPIKSLRTQDFTRHLSLAGNHTVVQSFHGCMCAMAKQIGFQDTVLKTFANKQQLMSYRPLNKTEEKPSEFFLSVLREKHVPVMIASIINEGKRGISQLLAQGSADLILDACSDVWNGEEISSLTDVERKKALSFFQRMSITRKCIAFSYRPVFQEEYQPGDLFMEFPSPLKKISSEKSLQDKLSPKVERAKKVRNDIECEEMLENVHSPLNVDVHIRNLQRQIFLGMVTLTHSLKEDVVTMVEQLNNAGIRFVHFSYDNELLSRVFCQRLGLETGWNCHISLGESYGTTTNIDDDSSVSESCPLLNDEENELLEKSNIKVSRCNSYATEKHDEQDEEDFMGSTSYDNYNELYFMSNRSKLPKGIQNMRPHLERIDDVPLLVPLFTDCNSDAVSEMIAIMQEYGDIVCCTGSILNTNNYKMFSQSDISIAMEPIFHQTCIWKHGQPHHEKDGTSSQNKNAIVSVSNHGVCEDATAKGPLALSASLNGLPCSLWCRRKDDFPIGQELCEARRISIACKSCFLFLLSCQFSLSLLMLVSSIFMFPPPLSGLQIMWLMIVIVPLLSVSLIGTPADKHLMKTITGKREKLSVVKGMIKPFLMQFISTFLINSLFIALCVFPCLLYSFCNLVSQEQCSYFLGARNGTAYWNGWYGELKGGFFFVQDIVLFYITITFIVLSISFVHRNHLVWQRLPYKNKPWCLCVFVSFNLQLLHTICSVYHWTEERMQLDLRFHNIPYQLTLCSMLWLIVLVCISEIIKRKHIKANIRFQKRAKLKFDTKLGMNSPV